MHRTSSASTAPSSPAAGGRSPAGVDRKLVVFVPADSVDDVRDALFAAGAGRIGEYERCSWYTLGTGTFRGRDTTQPTVGAAGRDEHVTEYRVEIVVPADRVQAAVAALRESHPYEEVALDVYALHVP